MASRHLRWPAQSWGRANNRVPCFTSNGLIGGRRAYSNSPGSANRKSNLAVNGSRLMKTLHETCQHGTGQKWGSHVTETGMSRLSLSDTDRKARDWFCETVKSLGCKVSIDSIGNIFAVRPGRLKGAPTFAGSHLDTQPSGGRYDGILGVMAAVEMLRVLEEENIETEYPVGAVNWTNEEGARFPLSMMGSGVWAQEVPLQHAYGLKDVSDRSVSLKTELEQIGYLGDVPANFESTPMAAHFELHIEQGPILESNEQKIGIVEGAQAYKWFTIEVRGQDAHTGTTPFENRSDALLLASKLIIHSHRQASKTNALASTGILTLEPGSTNTIPGCVRFSLDIRSPQDEIVADLESKLRHDFEALATGQDIDGLHAHGVKGKHEFQVSWQTDSGTRATHFHPDCIQCVNDAAVHALSTKSSQPEQLVRRMVSGAGHDSVYASRRCPTSMIFIPCRDGISHNPKEYSSPEDCELGAQVLLHSVLNYDQLRKDGKV